ncbi:hypothetical protein M407DRAFT_198750 [Tulasnella calospora MUT 4182]|uniref:Uncharacterized protein n=1 Tax=Tulasnella calospora MUT 4182 TaxID=1051891 RepID=A0A0C3LH44_9AGAM|nr:hypothetical protein M407DRAFT_198750 [Tulasnella calospora MUT 4182]
MPCLKILLVSSKSVPYQGQIPRTQSRMRRFGAGWSMALSFRREYFHHSITEAITWTTLYPAVQP